MNVSSVKNLNGEVFSAVQDASLTNVVQTNSGNWQDITAYQSNSASYLTAHQDLSDYQTTAGMVDYYTTADANTLSSMLSGAIDYVSANAGDEFPVSADEAIKYVQTNSASIDDTVTSYQTNSGDYIKESELEYNAVDEISGIAGSAISQYGAEKQWLVHDDTLVHLSNSAQYALGVNVSALQRLMGIDETVLWENSTGTYCISGSDTFILNEPASSFKKLQFTVTDNSYRSYNLSYIDSTITGFDLTSLDTVDTNTFAIRKARVSTNDYTNYTIGDFARVNFANNSTINYAGYYGARITKVIGIGRKA